VDEWGTWHKSEPGTNPGFLHQQSTVRDALVAGLTLNIFNNHAGRVRMANLAQTLNVLQAPILTEPGGPRMALTPTFHVFELFLPHHDAESLPVQIPDEQTGPDEARIPAVTASASRDAAGVLHVSVCHTGLEGGREIVMTVNGMAARTARGRVLASGDMHDHNTFDHPDAVQPVELTGIRVEAGAVRFTLPPASVATIAIEP